MGRKDGRTFLTNIFKEKKEKLFLLYKKRYVEEAIRQLKEGMRIGEEGGGGWRG